MASKRSICHLPIFSRFRFGLLRGGKIRWRCCWEENMQENGVSSEAVMFLPRSPLASDSDYSDEKSVLP
ncbi:hypothetical protein JTE90_012697 [Oedothorax gibbosus]|uniref:Uncharacterized protein n=1 Tax=Oedothorax gibbosus TaxID=931172 RepID=A0AAV6VX85_9ARAC|nr:hypothetical protein JTE90_012697 [Oedothorax gibbosus]